MKSQHRWIFCWKRSTCLVTVSAIGLFGCIDKSEVLAQEVAPQARAISMRSGSFMPEQMTVRSIADLLQSRLKELSADTLLSQIGKTHIVIQFKELPTRDQKEELRTNGIQLLSYLPGRAWIASVSEVALRDTNMIKTMGIRWAGGLEPEQKLSSAIKEGVLEEYVKLPEDPHASGKGIAITVLIFIVFLLGAMAVSILVMGQDSGLNFFLTYIVPPVSGFMLAIGPYWLGQTYGLVRGYLWAVLFVLGGVVIPVFNIASGYEAVGLLCTVIGLLTLATGAFMFVRFIRKHPISNHEVAFNG